MKENKVESLQTRCDLMNSCINILREHANGYLVELEKRYLEATDENVISSIEDEYEAIRLEIVDLINDWITER